MHGGGALTFSLVGVLRRLEKVPFDVEERTLYGCVERAGRGVRAGPCAPFAVLDELYDDQISPEGPKRRQC